MIRVLHQTALAEALADASATHIMGWRSLGRYRDGGSASYSSSKAILGRTVFRRAWREKYTLWDPVYNKDHYAALVSQAENGGLPMDPDCSTPWQRILEITESLDVIRLS